MTNESDTSAARKANWTAAEFESTCSHDASVLQPAPQISTAWLIVPCLACDFLMLPLFSSLRVRGGPGPSDLQAAFFFGIVGCVFAQGNLLAAWLAWGEGPFLRRLAMHWKIAVGLYLIWLVGVALSGDHQAREFAVTVALGLPLVSIAAQFPLWVARQWFGWRLVNESAGPAQPTEQPLAIRDLMLATILVAASLALARLAPGPQKRSELWTMWTVFFIFASVISSISLLPAGAILLRGHPFSRRLAWGGLYAASLISLPWVVGFVVRWYGTVPPPPRAMCVGLSSLMFTFASTLLLAAAIARDRGYLLMWGHRRRSFPAGKVPSERIRVVEPQVAMLDSPDGNREV